MSALPIPQYEGEFLAVDALFGLPGLPTTKSGAIRWLRARQITSKVVPGRGGPGGTRTEYAVAELPPQARAALAARTINGVRAVIAPVTPAFIKAGAVEGAKLALRADLVERAGEATRLESLKSSVSLRGKAQQRLDAKLEILRALAMYQQAGKLSIQASEIHFAAAYTKGDIEVSAPTRSMIPDVGASTLATWRRLIRTKGITALAGSYGNRKGDGKIDRQPQLRDFIIGMLVRSPHARATHIMEGIAARFGGTAIELPVMRSLERWIADWRNENAQTVTALANPDGWKNKYMTAFGSMSEGVVRLNQRWELDSTPADVMLTDGRHTVLGLIDVYSRRTRLFVSKTSKATAVAQLMRAGLLDFGVPEEVKTDNGSDYKSKHIARVVEGLEIKQTFCPPFQAWHKPHIERFFRTFSHGLVELLDGFIGHNVAERSAIEARKSFAERLMQKDAVVEISMSAAEFQQFCDSWIDAVYSMRPHDGLNDKTPFEVAAAWPHSVRRIEDERALDVLLGEGAWRTVQKRGVEIENAWFIAPELERHVGEKVLCLQLPDLGRLVIQGGPDLAFVCIAECPERTGIDRKEVAAITRERQKTRVQEARRALRATAKRARTDDIVEEILADRAAKAARLAPFPRPSIVHDSAGLSAAADAVAEMHRPARSSAELMSDDQARAERARIEQEIEAGADNELARRRIAAGAEEQQPVFENRHERVVWIMKRAKFRAITNEETEFLAAYRREQPTSYRQLQEMVDAQVAPADQEAPERSGAA
jgi:transposase InsO family protein